MQGQPRSGGSWETVVTWVQEACVLTMEKADEGVGRREGRGRAWLSSASPRPPLPNPNTVADTRSRPAPPRASFPTSLLGRCFMGCSVHLPRAPTSLTPPTSRSQEPPPPGAWTRSHHRPEQLLGPDVLFYSWDRVVHSPPGPQWGVPGSREEVRAPSLPFVKLLSRN